MYLVFFPQGKAITGVACEKRERSCEKVGPKKKCVSAQSMPLIEKKDGNLNLNVALKAAHN